MSNPKEKAKELVEKFTMDNTRQGERNGIKCALIAVEEMIDSGIKWMPEVDWWIEVKKQIQLI
jgi:hypothetical protein